MRPARNRHNGGSEHPAKEDLSCRFHRRPSGFVVADQRKRNLVVSPV